MCCGDGLVAAKRYGSRGAEGMLGSRMGLRQLGDRYIGRSLGPSPDKSLAAIAMQHAGELVAARGGRQPHIHFPLLALPALWALFVLGSALTGASGAAALSLLRALARSRAARAHALARGLSGRLSPKAGAQSLALAPLALLRAGAAVLAAEALRRFARALVASMSLMNACEERIDEDLRERLVAVSREPFGEGLPRGGLRGGGGGWGCDTWRLPLSLSA